jgi:hypothetical protein
VDVPEELVGELVETFRSRVVPEEEPRRFERRFELTCIQRNLKALGTFGYQASACDNPVYVPYMPRTLAHARRNLARQPRLQAAWEVLARHLEELR